ncbi:hypothetical protein GCM10010840_10390 [Deinococcus aerolatus]|uniref:GGDEF domain-containing protein n=1 Tax=Deinococcus aerolatus TaxID=522487 RepID=A0ABQ2G4I5_9DEIO|nr:diguanylate cyclase [Deinococcus aerolatus]GGL74196.1 hypothetical protein GCM10010840_10390 [Deinococcus aerolatus]
MGEAGRRDRWPAEFAAAAERPDRGHRDDLTGLPTRQAFLVHLQALCAQGTGSLLLCDLDHLKLINDTLGHPAGDAAIAAVAGTLRDRLQPGWAAYRLGGDEFAVLAPVTAEELEDWVRQAMAALVVRPGQPLRLSAGVSGLSAARTPQDVLAGVDRRLYAAKRRGRGRLVSDDDAPEQPDPDPRLLERDTPLAALTIHLQAALNTSPPDRPDGGVTVDVHAGPGGGLSAFLRVADRAAQLLGYQTVTVQGTRSRRLRQYGAWASATLNGTPVHGPAGGLGTGSAAAGRGMLGRLPDILPDPDRPLALLLDRPEDFDPHTLEAIAPLRAVARVCVIGRCATGNPEPSPALPLPGAPDAGAAPPVIQLLPLSDSAVGAVGGRLAGGPLAGPVQAWLAQRSGGVPAEIGRWLGALLLEARLRHEDPAQLVEAEPERAGAGGDWQWSAARHLPRPAYHNRPYLWGRAALFHAALAALGRGPVVVLTGPAGRGRTRLAEQLLMEYAPHMPGGAWTVSLAGIGRTEELLSRLAQTLLGQPADLGGLESVGRLLARRPTLLLLDDLPPGVGSAALERLLSFAPDTRMIITAYHPLGLRGEQVLALPLLDPDVVREALRPYPQAVDPALAARAADWVRGEPNRLQDVLRVLSIDPSGGLLDGLLDPSPAQAARPGGLALGQAERRTLTALGLFSDVFSLPWAQAVTGASPLTLAGLREHGYLVSVGQALYRLAGGLDVVDAAAPREAAAQAPPPPFLRQARRRALAELRRVLARPDPDHHREWLARLDTAYVPLRSLLTGLLRGGPATGPETALVDAVMALTPYRISRTYFLDARADLEQLLRASEAATSEEAARGEVLPPRASTRLAEVRLALARTLQHLGDYAPAITLTRAVRANPGLSARLHVGALLAEARILHRRSEYSSALDTYRHAQTLLTRSGAARRAPALLAQALDGQARCLIYLDQLPLARRLSTRALAALGPERDPLRRALLLNTAALIETEDRHLEAADACLRAALQLHEDHADREGQILNRMGLAWVRLLRGDGEGSVRLGRELLREAQDAAQIWEIANILLNLGHAERLCGRTEAARAHYLDVEKLVSEQDAPSLHAELLGGLAACAHDEDRPTEARRLLALALGHPGANGEVRRFYAPLQTLLTAHPVEVGDSQD